MSNYSRLQPVTSNTNSVLPTPLPSNIGSNFGTSLRNASNVNTYTVSGYIFGSIDYDLINAPQILNCNALFDTDGFSYKFMNFASGVSVSTITVNSGPNTDGSNLSNVKWSVSLSNNTTGTSLWSCNYDFLNTLYGLNSYTNIVSSDTQTNLSISTRDMYSNHSYKSGFYMTATPTIQLNASIIPASSNAYTLTFGTNSLDEARSNTCNFYVDSLLNTTPTGSIFVENTGGITFCNICGRSVITSSKFNFWIDTSNIGRYFIHSNAVTANLSNGWCNFAFDMRTTPFYNNCNILDGSIYTASPISNTTYFYWSNVTITPSYRATFGTTVGDELSLFLSNLNGGSIRIPGNFTPYFDPESVALLSQNVRVTSGRATYGIGADIVACNNPAPGTFGEPYNNNENIQTNSDYTGELLLYNGAYRFLNNFGLRYNQHFSGNNLNPRGSDIITQPTTYGSINNYIRNVTFIFSNINPPNIYSKLSYVTLLLTYYNGDSVPSLAAQVGQFYEDANFFIRIGSNIPLTVNDSSGWLNANKYNTSISKSISLSDKILDNTTINCLCNSINEGINHKLTIIIPDGCGYSNMNLYTRYGSFTNNNVALKSIQIFSSNEINIPSYFTVSSNTPSNGNPNDTTTVTFNTNNLGLPSNLYYFQLSNMVYNTIDNTIFTSSNQNMSPLISNYTILNHPSMPPGTYSNYIQIWTNPNLGEPYMFWSSNYILTVSGRAPLQNDFSLSVINNNTLNVGVRVTLTNNNLQPNNNFYYFKVRALYYNELFPTAMFTPDFYTSSYNLTTTPSDRFIDYDPRFYNCNIALENIFLDIKASNAMGTVENDIRASTGPQCNVDMPSFPSFIGMINYVTGDITFKGAVNEVNLGSLEWNISRSNSGAANFSNFYDVNNKGGSNFTDPGIKFDVPSGELPNFYYDTTYKLYASNTCNVLGWGPPRSNSSDFYLGTPSLPSNFVFNLSNNNTLDVNITPTTDFLGITNYFYYSVSNTSPKKIGSSIDSCNITTPSGLIYPYFDGPYEFGTNVGILHDPEVYGQEFRFYLFGSNILGKVETESNIIAYTGPQCNFDTPVLSNTFNAIINCNSGEITFYGGVAALSNSLGALTWNIYLSNIIFTTYTKLYSDFSYDSNFILNGLSKTIPVGSNSNYYYDSSYQLIASNTSNLRGWITPSEVLRTNNIGGPPLPSNYNVITTNDNSLNVFITPTLVNPATLPTYNRFYYTVSNTSNTKRDGTTLAIDVLRSIGVEYQSYSGPIEFGNNATIVYDPEIYNQDITFTIYGSNYLGQTDFSNVYAYTGLQCNVDVPTVSDFITTIDCNTGSIQFTGSVTLNNNLGDLKWYIKQQTTTSIDDFLGPYPGQSNNFSISSNIPIGSNILYYYRDSSNINSYGNIITGQYFLFACNTSNAGWVSKENVSCNSIVPFSPFPYIDFNVSEIGNLSVSIRPTLCNPYLGPAGSKFYYFITGGNNILPASYNGPHDMGSIVGISNILGEPEDEFTTNLYQQWGCNIKFHVAISNALYTYDSNFYHLQGSNLQQTSNIYTGPQCNFDTPVLSNTFNAIINCNSGEITFYGGVAALSNSLGALTWNIYLSNIIFTTYTKLYSDFSYDSNFILNGLSKTIPVGSNSNYYYDSSYQLIASNTSNLRGWITPSEVLRTNNIGGPPLPSNYNVITTNDNSLNVFITPTLVNPATLPTYNRFYYTVSNTSNTKRDGTTLAIDVLRSIGVEYQSYSGPIEFGNNATIVYDPEIYNQDITFTIYGSNYLGQTDFSNVYAYTGLQCNVDVPTVSDFITTIDCNTGSIQFTGSVTLNNNLGDLKWYIKQQTTTSIDDFLGPYPGQSNNFSISSNIPIGSNILYYYRDSSNINSYGNIITGQYFLFACNTSNAGWVSKENVSCNSIVPFSPFPYIDFNVSEIGNLSVSIRPTLCNPYLGPAGSKFYYFITGGNNILPASYNGPHDMGSIVGISNILGEPEDEFTTNLYQQWGCNIKFHVAISNALYTYDSNFYHLQGSNLQEISNIYTGPQCNGNIPNILDFSANINCNTGKITFSGNVEKVTLGEVEWNISRSNNDTADFINFYYSNKIGASNFVSPGILWDIPDNEPSNFYYNTTYKIFASNNCNVRGWQTDQTYISYNFIIHGAPLPSNFLVTLYNNNSLNVYIIPTLINPSSLPECNSFYYTISNIHLNKRLGSPLACNILTSNKLLQYPDFDGPYPFNTPARILYDIEVYDQDFKFYIYGSNIFGTTSNTLKNYDAYTGPPYDLDTPTITDFSINSIDPNDGTLSISANVSNIGGTLTYYIVYFNKYTYSNIYQPLDYINTPFNGPSNIVDYKYTPFNFLQLYDNIVTIYATNKFNPIVKEFSSSLTTDSYSLATPGLQPIESIYQVNKYIFTTSINNYSYDDIPEITTIWTLLYFSIDVNSYIDITNDISESTNSNIQYNFGDANILYVIKAQFSISNAYNLFYGPISRQKITIYDNIDTAEFRLENTGIINASAVYPNGIIYIDCIFYTSDDKVVSGESIPIIININDNEYITVTYNQNEFDNNGETLNRLVFDGTRGLVTDININLTTDNTFKSDYAIITVLYNKES